MKKFTFTLGTAVIALSLAGCGQDAAPKKDAKSAKVTPKKGDKKKSDKKKGGKKKGDKKKAAADGVASLTAGMKEFSEGKLDDCLKHFDKDVEWAAIGLPEAVKGHDKLKASWEEFRKSFPDIKVAPERIIDTGDIIFAQVVSNGTHKGEFNGVPATDKPVGNAYMHIFEMKDGKVTKATLIENMGNMMAQIGATGKDAPPAIAPPAFPEKAEIIKGKPNKANEETLRKWYASFDWALCQKELCTADITHHDVAEGKTAKGDENEAQINAWKTAFPDMKMEVKLIASAGDYVVAVVNAKGTHKGDMGPIKATGKSVNMTYAEVNKFENGKMKESWGYHNPMEVMGQLGLLPPPAAPGDVAQK